MHHFQKQYNIFHQNNRYLKFCLRPKKIFIYLPVHLNLRGGRKVVINNAGWNGNFCLTDTGRDFQTGKMIVAFV